MKRAAAVWWKLCSTNNKKPQMQASQAYNKSRKSSQILLQLVWHYPLWDPKTRSTQDSRRSAQSSSLTAKMIFSWVPVNSSCRRIESLIISVLTMILSLINSVAKKQKSNFSSETAYYVMHLLKFSSTSELAVWTRPRGRLISPGFHLAIVSISCLICNTFLHVRYNYSRSNNFSQRRKSRYYWSIGN